MALGFSMKTDLVVVGSIIHKGKILLIKHKKLSKWLPPGGHIEKDETPDEAVAREIREEVGLEVEILNKNDLDINDATTLQLANPFHVEVHSAGDHLHCCFCYLCRPKTTEIKLNRAEADDVAWFSKQDLNNPKITRDIRAVSMLAMELFESQNI